MAWENSCMAWENRGEVVRVVSYTIEVSFCRHRHRKLAMSGLRLECGRGNKISVSTFKWDSSCGLWTDGNVKLMVFWDCVPVSMIVGEETKLE